MGTQYPLKVFDIEWTFETKKMLLAAETTCKLCYIAIVLKLLLLDHFLVQLFLTELFENKN